MKLFLEKVINFFKNEKAPWTARSPNELLKNIRNQPLKFPGNVSNDIKDLLI